MPKEKGSIYSLDTINNGAACKNDEKPYVKCTMTSLSTVIWERGEGFKGCCFCRFDLGCNGQDPRGLRFDPFSCFQFLHWKKIRFAHFVCNVWPIHIHVYWKCCQTLYLWMNHVTNLPHLKIIFVATIWYFEFFIGCHILPYSYCKLPTELIKV